jgi:hypothetical protein
MRKSAAPGAPVVGIAGHGRLRGDAASVNMIELADASSARRFVDRGGSGNQGIATVPVLSNLPGADYAMCDLKSTTKETP